ncbi:hypothetical protein [Flavobacterium sp.]|uniref:hypothetical protein n=2 Tax=Flavobacterium sp. TaxID=239 RepID=UPI004033C2B5
MIKKLFFLALLLNALNTTAQITADLNSIPADWTKLTEMEDGLVVYNTCDGGNLRLKLYKEKNKWYLLSYGQQEDYLFEVKKASGTKTIVLDGVWDGSDEKQQFSFSWTDRSKGLGRWEAKGWDWDHTFVSLWDEVNHLHIVQPCKECWEEEECGGLDDYYEPIDGIRAIFANYVHYGESTDSDENKAIMTKALDKLKGKKLLQTDLQLLAGVWMYYDPTDFDAANKKAKALLIANKSESIRAIKYMIGHKRDWESVDTAPYSELPLLLQELEGKK